MKKILLTALTLLLLFLFCTAGWYFSRLHHPAQIHSVTLKKSASPDKDTWVRITDHAAQAAAYAREHHFNERLLLLVDMKLPSGANRFFAFDSRADTLLFSGLVTHGSCNTSWLMGRRFGNQPGCGCSSLGKYKIGKPYYGRFGRAYKLYGLDSTNSNALRRNVVLHSHPCVPEQPVAPYPICQSLGCPTVSPAFLKQLSFLLDQSNQPVLLLIYQ